MMKTEYFFRPVFAFIPLLFLFFSFSIDSYSQDCEFDDVEVEEKDCENGEFFAKVDLENEGGSEQFQLWVNGVDYGLFYYEDVPLYLGPFPADGMTTHVFAGADAGMADCGFLYTLDPVECEEDDDGDGGDEDAATFLIENLYPLPARDRLGVTFNESMADKSITIEIMDMNGMLYHYQKSDGSRNALINIESMKPGIYFIRVIENASTVEVKKFLVR